MAGAWSVKGIDPRARAAAKDLATSRGQTLGELLNELLMETGPADRPDNPMGTPMPEFPSRSGQPRESTMDTESPTTRPPTERMDDAARVAKALERLTSKIEAVETRSALAIAGMDQSVLGLVARIDNSDRVTRAVAGRVDRSMEDLKSTHAALVDRVQRIEADNVGRQSLEGLRTLEQALGRLAAHVYTHDEQNAQDSAALRRELAATVARIDQASQQVDQKVEQTLTRAAAQVEAIADKAELRAHGATRDLSDKVREIESRIATKMHDLEARLGDGKSGLEALGTLEASLGRIQDRLSQAEGTTDAAIKGLEASFNSLDSKIAALSKAGGGEDLRQIVERRFEGLAESLTRSVTEARAELARQIEDATKAMRPESIAKLEYSLENVQARLAQAETRQAQTMAAISEELKKVSKVMGQRLRNVEGRNDGAAAETVREELNTVTRALEGRLVEIEARSAHAIEAVGTQIERIADKVDARIVESEARSAKAITEVGDHMARMTQILQARQEEQQKQVLGEIKALEARHDSRLSDALAGVTDRLATLQTETRQSVSPVHTALAALVKRIESVEAFSRPPGVAPPPIETSAFSGASGMTAFAGSAGATALPGSARAEARPDFGNTSKDPFADPDFAAFNSALDEPNEPLGAPPAAPTKAQRPNDPFDFGAALDRLQSGNLPTAAPEPPPVANDLDVGDQTYTADLPPIDGDPDEDEIADDQDHPADHRDSYLDRARRAAQESLTPDHRRSSSKQPRVKRNRVKSATGSSGSKAPFLIAAGVVALTVGVTAAYVLINRPADGSLLPWDRDAQGATDVQHLDRADDEDGAAPTAAAVADEEPPEAPDPNGSAEGPAIAEPDVTAKTLTVARVSAVPAITPPKTDTVTGAVPPPVPSRSGPAPTPSMSMQGAASVTNLPPVAAPVLASVQRPASASPSAALPAQAPDLSGEPVTLEAAAARGDAISQFLLASQKQGERDFVAAASLFQRAAAQNMPAAQYRLAKLYETGQGVPRDLSEAKRNIERAAAAGHVKAMHDLALFFTDGVIAPQSYVTAVEWFRKAANFGLVDSQFNLGLVMDEGHGVAPNPAEALYWYEIARRNGDQEAVRKIENLTPKMDPDLVKVTLERAAAFRPQVADPAVNGRFQPAQFAANGSQRVMDLQKALTRLGLDPGPIDGVLTSKTRVAIQRFQRSRGQPETGQISDELMRQVLAAAS